MKLTFIFILLILFNNISSQQVSQGESNIPFTTDTAHIQIWNNSEYIPFFIKGSNLGVSIPGKFPGELEVTRAQYGRWFSLIKEAGFNSIRLYTLHYPDFYEVLDSFNIANPSSPLYFFQGVWMEEELPLYNYDLYFLYKALEKEIEENIDCVHGNRSIEPRLGKADGTYTRDVSKWNIAYIVGRETSPNEVLTTNRLHPNDTIFNGTFFSIKAKAAEVFIARQLEHLVNYENSNYNTQRPVSFSSWPTLDPLKHPMEFYRDEDTASIDLSMLDFENAPAGFFISYHAYPYYPDFISNDPNYQIYSDEFGPNSYLGYLTKLKEHYKNIPLIIAETGVPSSWGIAHYASSGMNHGGFDQQKQGETILRLFHNVEDADCGGAIHFSFMDEWFKRTWITDYIDYDGDRRILWHNVMGAEQNFGLIGFQRPLNMQNWANFNPSDPITIIQAAADYDFFHIRLGLSEEMENPDDIWISLDTYNAELGESILPNGDTIQDRAEFALHITNYAAEIYVTQAYDIFGIWHNTSNPSQLYHSILTDGAPWVIERWKNNKDNDQVQYVGNLQVNKHFLPSSSKDAVTIYPDSIDIKIPWSLLHFADPSQMKVFHDYRSTNIPEDTVSDGIYLNIFYHNRRFETGSRFTWEKWNTALDVIEYKKASYDIVKAGLTAFNNPAIAVSDNYLSVNDFPYSVSETNGVLKNDFDFDGNFFQSIIITNPAHGDVDLYIDGSFTYYADADYVGQDCFEYSIFDGLSLSKPAYVCLNVENTSNTIINHFDNEISFLIYPNPAKNTVKIQAEKLISDLMFFSIDGKLISTYNVNDYTLIIDISNLPDGPYIVKSTVEGEVLLNRLIISK